MILGTNGQRIGYIRVSSIDQSCARQLDAQRGTLNKVFEDKVSGKDQNRPGLQEMLIYVREGDTVVVHSMDRLARNLVDLLGLMQSLVGKGVTVEFVKEHLTFSPNSVDPMSNLLLSVMGAFAEFERSIIKERQREGIAIARAKRAYKGRKKRFTEPEALSMLQLKENGASITKIAQIHKASRATIYRYLRDLKLNGADSYRTGALSHEQ